MSSPARRELAQFGVQRSCDKNRQPSYDLGLEYFNDLCLNAVMNRRTYDFPALEKAVAKAGGQSALAAAIGKTQGHISQWLRRKHIPAESVIAIERATGVSRRLLRPDLYGDAA